MISFAGLVLRVILSLAIIGFGHALLYYFGASTKKAPEDRLGREQPSEEKQEAGEPPAPPSQDGDPPNQEVVADELREYLRELRAKEQRSKDNS